MLDVLRAVPEFENLAPDGGPSPRPDWRPRTKYEHRGERLGHPVFDLVFRRMPPSGEH
jgi:tRNA (guanine-N7-)-methyltransferase